MNQFQAKFIAGSRPDLLATQDLPSPPQQKRSRRKRQEILDAALLLFQERGYEATTIEDISRQAGVAVGGFYQHFRSKRQVLLVLMDCLLDELSSSMNLHLGDADDAAVALERIVRNGISVDWTYAGAYRAWREVIMQDPELGELNLQITTWTTARIMEVLRDALQLPGARRQGLDIETMAWILDLLFWQLAGISSGDLEAVVRVMTHLLYHALFQDERPFDLYETAFSRQAPKGSGEKGSR